MVGESQGAFVENRQILGGIIIANELVRMRRKDKKLGLLFKIDMEKVYNFVDWSFMRYLFERMCFGCCWRWWIKGCVEESTYSIFG